MTETSGLEAMRQMYPRPRVGQYVKLKRGGPAAEVIIVRKARDVLKTMNEMQAMLLGPKCQALYGVYWLDVYYEAIVMVPGAMVQQTVTPIDIEAILDPP